MTEIWDVGDDPARMAQAAARAPDVVADVEALGFTALTVSGGWADPARVARNWGAPPSTEAPFMLLAWLGRSPDGVDLVTVQGGTAGTWLVFERVSVDGTIVRTLRRPALAASPGTNPAYTDDYDGALLPGWRDAVAWAAGDAVTRVHSSAPRAGFHVVVVPATTSVADTLAAHLAHVASHDLASPPAVLDGPTCVAVTRRHLAVVARAGAVMRRRVLAAGVLAMVPIVAVLSGLVSLGASPPPDDDALAVLALASAPLWWTAAGFSGFLALSRGRGVGVAASFAAAGLVVGWVAAVPLWLTLVQIGGLVGALFVLDLARIYSSCEGYPRWWLPAVRLPLVPADDLLTTYPQPPSDPNRPAPPLA